MSSSNRFESAAQRGKYAPLYRHLVKLAGNEWRTTFSEIEKLLGFTLPDSARTHRPWWANQGERGGHSHALAWETAGWRTSRVDLGNESLVFVRTKSMAHQQAEKGYFPRPDDNQGKDFGITDEEWKAAVDEIKKIGASNTPWTPDKVIRIAINKLRGR